MLHRAPACLALFMVGILLGEMSLPSALFLATILAIVLFILRVPRERDMRLLLLAWMAAGIASGVLATPVPPPSFTMSELTGETIEGVAKVREFPRESEYGPAVVADMTAFRTLGEKPSEWKSTASGLFLRFRGEAYPAKGETFRFVSSPYPFRNLGIPGEYDREGSERERGVFLGGIVEEGRWERIAPAGPLDRRLTAIRARIAQAAKNKLDDEAGGVFSALSMGDQYRIPRDLINAYRDAGVVHLVAISGLHLAILFLIIRLIVGKFMGLSERLLLHINVPLWSGLLSIPLLASYAWMVGAKPPVIRALMMLIVALTAQSMGRRSRGLEPLCWAGVVLLAVDPRLLFSVSFQLSFTAVLAAIVWTGARPFDPPRNKLVASGRYLWAALLSSLVATLWTAPWTTFHFGQFSMAGLLANLPLIPFVSFLLTPAAFALAILAAIAPNGPWPWDIFVWGTQLANGMARFFADLPGARVNLRLDDVELTAIFAGLAAITLFVRARSKPWRRGFALAAVGILVALLAYEGSRKSEWDTELRLDVVSVGQGDAILVTSRGRHMLIDTGGIASYGKPADGPGIYERLLRPYFLAVRVHALDRLILTHPHEDHVGGASDLMADMKVGELVIPAAPVIKVASPSERGGFLAVSQADAKKQKIRAKRKPPGGIGFAERRTDIIRAAAQAAVPVNEWKAGMVLHWQAVTITVLHPSADFLAGHSRRAIHDNDISLVLRLETASGACALLTGDAETASEGAMLSAGLLKPCGLLKAGHHGSRTSSGIAFLEAVVPELALISVGFRNRYQHPHPEALQRLQESSVQWYATGHHGTLTAWAEEGKWRVHAYGRRPARLFERADREIRWILSKYHPSTWN